MDEGHPVKIVINGKEYHRLEEVPPEFRTMVEKQLCQALERVVEATKQPDAVETTDDSGRNVIKRIFKFEKRIALSFGKKPAAPSSPGDSPASPRPIESSSWALWGMLATALILVLLFLAKRFAGHG